MTLDDIPADVQMTMTVELQRLFRMANCDPACHHCGEDIEVGSPFMLAEVEGKDEMLGGCCTKDQLTKLRKKESREHAAYKKTHPGYSRPHVQEASR